MRSKPNFPVVLAVQNLYTNCAQAVHVWGLRSSAVTTHVDNSGGFEQVCRQFIHRFSLRNVKNLTVLVGGFSTFSAVPIKTITK